MLTLQQPGAGRALFCLAGIASYRREGESKHVLQK